MFLSLSEPEINKYILILDFTNLIDIETFVLIKHFAGCEQIDTFKDEGHVTKDSKQRKT